MTWWCPDAHASKLNPLGAPVVLVRCAMHYKKFNYWYETMIRLSFVCCLYALPNATTGIKA